MSISNEVLRKAVYMLALAFEYELAGSKARLDWDPDLLRAVSTEESRLRSVVAFLKRRGGGLYLNFIQGRDVSDDGKYDAIEMDLRTGQMLIDMQAYYTSIDESWQQPHRPVSEKDAKDFIEVVFAGPSAGEVGHVEPSQASIALAKKTLSAALRRGPKEFGDQVPVLRVRSRR